MSEVPSPCIKVCNVGSDGICRGCYRTLSEIAAWRESTDEARLAILAAVVERCATSGAGQVAQQP